MSKSAEKLFIAQPSVSQAIGELERHLKVKLFERLGRRLFLTPEGQEFAAYARHIMALSREAEVKMEERSKGGFLRVGGTMSVGTSILSSLIGKFKEEFSDVDVFFRVANTADLERELLEDRIDIALSEGLMKSPQLESRPLIEDELLIIAPYGYLSRDEYLSIEEFRELPFILREEGSGSRELFESVMVANEIDYKVTGVLNNVEAIKHAVAAGLGFSALSKATIEDEIERKEIKTLKMKGISFHRHFSLIIHRNKFVTAAMDDFIALCEKTFI